MVGSLQARCKHLTCTCETWKREVESKTHHRHRTEVELPEHTHGGHYGALKLRQETGRGVVYEESEVSQLSYKAYKVCVLGACSELK